MKNNEKGMAWNTFADYRQTRVSYAKETNGGTKYYIYRDLNLEYWFLAKRGEEYGLSFAHKLYRSKTVEMEDTPPTTGWETVGRGISPAPELRLSRASPSRDWC